MVIRELREALAGARAVLEPAGYQVEACSRGRHGSLYISKGGERLKRLTVSLSPRTSNTTSWARQAARRFLRQQKEVAGVATMR